MKEIKIQNTNNQISKRHNRKYDYWKRAAALFMALIIFFTADSGIMGLFTVLAAENKQTDCVITAFYPLSEEIEEQIVTFGTPLEELKLPDTLEAVCTYEQKEENAQGEGSGANEAGQEETDETVADESGESENSDKKDDTEEDTSNTDNTDNAGKEGSAETNDNANDGTGSDSNGGSTEIEDNTDGDSNGGSAGTEENTDNSSSGGFIGTDDNADGSSNDSLTETGSNTESGKDSGLDESGKEQSGLSRVANRIGSAVVTVKEMVIAAVMIGEQKLMSLGILKSHADAEIDSTNTNVTDKTLIDITDKTLIDAADKTLIDATDKMLMGTTDKTLIDTADISDFGQSETEKGSETEFDAKSEPQIVTETVNIEVALWNCIPEYDSATEGNYIFTPVLPEGFTLSEGISLPEIVVVVESESQEAESQDMESEEGADRKAAERINRSSFNAPYAVVGAKADASTGECGANGDNVTYTLTDSNGDGKYDTLTIKGTGNMADYVDSLAPWGDCASDITTISIESGVTSVGNCAFYRCSALKEVTLPDNISSIGASAFNGCSSLEKVKLPTKVENIGGFAFEGCSALTQMEIPASVTSVSFYAFSGCFNMVLYYSSASGVQSTGTKANVAYTITEEGKTDLKITKVGSGIKEIDFPANVGGAPIASSDWKDHPTITITHTGSSHNYVNGECAICGDQEAPKIEIDYVEERLIGFIEGKTYSITVAGKIANVPADAASGVEIDETWFGKTISIIAKGNGAGQSVSGVQELAIDARPSAPTNLSSTNVSYNAADGTISGVKIGMQYKKMEDTVWKPVTENPIPGLAAGEYEVRVAAVQGKSFASKPAKVTVEEYAAKKEETPKASINYLQESLTGLIANAIYFIDGTEVAADENGAVTIPDSWMDNKQHPIVKAGNPPTTKESDAQMLTIPKRPNAPTGIKTKNETEEGKGGTLTGLKTSMEYRKADDSGWTEIKGNQTTITGLEPGIYEIRLKATSTKFASQIVEKAIAAVNMTPEKTPNAKINFRKAILTGLVSRADYLINDELISAETDGTIEIKQEWFGSTIDIVKAGNDATTTDSDSQLLDIPPRPPAPIDVDSVPESDTNKKDGKLTGVNNEMEYRKADGEWKEIKKGETTVTGLTPGFYEVRIKATDTSFSSESVTMVVTGNELVPEPTPDAGIEFYDECFIYLDMNSTYLINGKEKQTDESGTVPLQSGWIGKKISIVKKGDNVATKNSEAQEFTVPKRPPAPKGIKAVAESAENAKDSRLTGVDNTMVYRKSGSKEWLSMEEKINEIEEDLDEIEEDLNAIKLEPGEYEIRYAATYESFASSVVKVKIPAYGEEEEKMSSEEDDSSSEEDGDADNNNSENTQRPELKKEDKAQPQPPEEPEEKKTTGVKLQPKKIESGTSDSGETEQEAKSTQWELTLEGNQTIDLPEGGNVITVPTKVESGRLVPQTAGRTQAGATESGNQVVVLLVEQGAVIVTVNNIEEDLCSARVADSVAVANAVLNAQDVARAAKGEIEEIRIDVNQIDSSVSQADKQLIEQGMESYQDEIPDLQMGMYVDISVFVRIGEDKWNAVEVTSELVEIIINIPDTLKALSADFYTMRAHGGEYCLLEDMDDVTETITIRTHLFSTYAVIYQLRDIAIDTGNSATTTRIMQWLSAFFENYGLILLVVLLVEIIVILLVMLYLQHKRKEEKGILT